MPRSAAVMEQHAFKALFQPIPSGADCPGLSAAGGSHVYKRKHRRRRAGNFLPALSIIPVNDAGLAYSPAFLWRHQIDSADGVADDLRQLPGLAIVVKEGIAGCPAFIVGQHVQSREERVDRGATRIRDHRHPLPVGIAMDGSVTARGPQHAAADDIERVHGSRSHCVCTCVRGSHGLPNPSRVTKQDVVEKLLRCLWSV